ncbi:CapA family protein, partial [Candidatus Gribaldobacteria bacterium]|nr:CapA family protein [Candidatus Gribaldobacteria bacterium]
HIIQKLDQYQGKWIAYSLGNFIFDQAFSEETMQGGWLEITLKGKEIKEVILKKVKLNEFYQPILEN